MKQKIFSLTWLLLLIPNYLVAQEANRLVYLDQPCDPYYVHGEFPALITPQWVGDPGVEAVIVLSIDDMRDPAHFEAFLRPILQRLKKIDGRAPVSIMTNTVDTQLPFLQSWLDEGLSIDVHTIDHPCPCLHGGDFAKAAKTYHDCVDMMAAIPNSRPVAFRMPCCDSQNTPSPRFWAEIFHKRSSQGNFLTIDSSVFNVTTPADDTLPVELVFNERGESRFKRYIPFPSFVNTIENYPYPYVISNLSWQFPCVVPTDWQAQHVQRSNNPDTVDDMKRALDVTVIKQGVYNLVFHPHGWIGNEQIVELIDYVDKKYGSRIKFLTFPECAQRLEEHLLLGQSLRDDVGNDNGVRLLDLNNDRFMDVFIANHELQATRVWMPDENAWKELAPPGLLPGEEKKLVAAEIRFGVLEENGFASMLVRSESFEGAWTFSESGWQQTDRLMDGLSSGGEEVFTSQNGIDQGVRLRDVDNDGCCELIVGGVSQTQAVLRWNGSKWTPLDFELPDNISIVDKNGRDAGLRFVDINGDSKDDIIYSNTERWSASLFVSIEKGWNATVAASRGEDNLVPPIVRGTTNNGAWFHSNHLWIQNEDTNQLPDGVDRLPLGKLLQRIKEN